MARIWDLSELPYLGERQHLNFRVGPECDDVIAVGGNLSPGLLLSAYQQGVFPWYNEGQDIYWWSPRQRFTLLPDRLHLPKSLIRHMRRSLYLGPAGEGRGQGQRQNAQGAQGTQGAEGAEGAEDLQAPQVPGANTYDLRLSLDEAFADVINACSATPRPEQLKRDGSAATWITPEMRYAYVHLHMRGYAHSVECWRREVHGGETLVGGLYGIGLGRCFFGESMFSHAPDASKIAFAGLALFLFGKGFRLIDCQEETEHLRRFGAVSLPRDDFEKRLRECEPELDLRDRLKQRAFWMTCCEEFPDSPSLRKLLGR
ncbi:leucyl/phenylalanyl-tRNA--protein transferase [Candidatus Haliotispira prima]|uniref:Leucyl/phenylalanyl-tRNA--protein transferase n=1 Tax=Candidatus Haliotispira prima TaxID=3034016 RepID=A0ABY8MLT1_9SPIO|nr:leucyl/phenylalanyl-tRNA--protein transferase [Candidatus Haliotispira prima]